MTSQVLNFLWLNLDLPAKPDPADGTIREPLPARYIENTRNAGKAHPSAEIVLWVDSKRLTERQMEYLRESVEEGMPNVHLKDLRDIPAYEHEPLYNEAETNPCWRGGWQTSMIWRQVDAAKVLVSLQGDFDQAFFADLDHAHLDIESTEVQNMIGKHGLMIGSGSAHSAAGIENQLWGFDHRRRDFFEQYYATSLERAYKKDNAFLALCNKVDRELLNLEGIPIEEICFPMGDDGTRAEQPGHEWRGGWFEEYDAPSSIPVSKLAGDFRKSSSKDTHSGLATKAEKMRLLNQIQKSWELKP